LPAVRSCTAWISAACGRSPHTFSISWPTSSGRQPSEPDQLGLPGQLGQQRANRDGRQPSLLRPGMSPITSAAASCSWAGEEHQQGAATTRPPSAGRR
jgi:hypothetical protein